MHSRRIGAAARPRLLAVRAAIVRPLRHDDTDASVRPRSRWRFSPSPLPTIRPGHQGLTTTGWVRWARRKDERHRNPLPHLFWVLLGGVLVMRTDFSLQVKRAGERLLPDQQAIQREGRGAFAVRFVVFFVLLAFLVLYALDVPWLRLLIPLPPWLRWAGFVLGLVSLAWWAGRRSRWARIGRRSCSSARNTAWSRPAPMPGCATRSTRPCSGSALPLPW